MQRRVLLYKLENPEDYANYLQEHPAKVQALYEEISIHVTSFFCDAEVFEQLKTQVFPTISQNKSADTPIRIWVAGCSAGKEVYSIAICLLEFFSDLATMPPIQIFATDISEAAINRTLIWQVRLLNVEPKGQIPVAALTASASNGEKQLAIEAGFQVHVAKPVEPTQLALLVGDVVR